MQVKLKTKHRATNEILCGSLGGLYGKEVAEVPTEKLAVVRSSLDDVFQRAKSDGLSTKQLTRLIRFVDKMAREAQ